MSEGLLSVQILSGLDTEASGPSYTVPRLARAVSMHGCAAEILTLGAPGRSDINGVPVTRCGYDPSGLRLMAKLGRSRALRDALLQCNGDVFHTHGLWMMPNVYPAEAARRRGRPLVLSPRGMLGRGALKFSYPVKRAFWSLYQARAARQVACFHATADQEFEDIRRFGLRQPVAVIPNGVDLPELVETAPDNRRQDAPYVLSLGRIHPKKGLDRLIAAWAAVVAEHPGWRLRIVGPDQGGYAAVLARQATGLGLSPERFSIEEPVFGDAKLRLMAGAEVFALATLDENFGMTVAESLAVETPVISTTGAPWAGLREHGCGWWIDHGPEAMAAALREAMAMTGDQRQAMGARGRLWMQRDFGWNGIGAKMADVYRWLCAGGDRPQSVRTD